MILVFVEMNGDCVSYATALSHLGSILLIVFIEVNKREYPLFNMCGFMAPLLSYKTQFHRAWSF